MDAKPGYKIAPGLRCLCVTASSQPADLSTLGAFACGFKAPEQAGRYAIDQGNIEQLVAVTMACNCDSNGKSAG